MRAAVLISLMLLVAGGCASNQESSKTSQINAWLLASQANVPPGVYRVQPPDVIKVAAPRIRELDGQGGQIRSDGKVVFNLVGQVYVAGMTTTEISETLTKALRKYYTQEALDIAVEVTEFRSKAVYVFGPVHLPGAKPYTGRDTLLGVLADAGFNDESWPERVMVVRPNENPDVRQKVTIDVSRMYDLGDTSQNVLLEEGDLVYVPPTPLAKVTRAINLILIPIRPAAQVAVLAAGGI